MTSFPPAFTGAVLDALLPGDHGFKSDAPAPTASEIGLSDGRYVPRHHAVFSAIASHAGGADGFVALNADERRAVLADVERADVALFRALVQDALADYYEHPEVIAAFGWRHEPPQPNGHSAQVMSEEMRARLQRMHARGPIWRDPR